MAGEGVSDRAADLHGPDPRPARAAPQVAEAGACQGLTSGQAESPRSPYPPRLGREFGAMAGST